jgi:hypothetical protein
VTTQDFKRKLTGIMSADVAGYSRLMGKNEAAAVKTLEAYGGPCKHEAKEPGRALPCLLCFFW